MSHLTPTAEYLLALMAGVGIGTTIVIVGRLLWLTAVAIDARISARINARIDAESDREFAARLAELDVRNERLAGPGDGATV